MTWHGMTTTPWWREKVMVYYFIITVVKQNKVISIINFFAMVFNMNLYIYIFFLFH